MVSHCWVYRPRPRCKTGMARDYKHAQRRRSASQGASAWAGLLVGLIIGLTVALAIYLYDRRPEAGDTRPGAPITSDERSATDRQARTPASQTAESGTQFDFYEMLPKFEVVIPEEDGEVRPGVSPATVERPGAYVLQAGSFRNFADADRMRATLALQGIESRIQKVTVDTATWHRVRIGPIADLKQLENTRRRLREAQIDALVIRVGD